MEFDIYNVLSNDNNIINEQLDLHAGSIVDRQLYNKMKPRRYQNMNTLNREYFNGGESMTVKPITEHQIANAVQIVNAVQIANAM